jgi:hypothetical protein
MSCPSFFLPLPKPHLRRYPAPVGARFIATSAFTPSPSSNHLNLDRDCRLAPSHRNLHNFSAIPNYLWNEHLHICNKTKTLSIFRMNTYAKLQGEG